LQTLSVFTRMKRKPKVIQGKELLKQLAELSGYRIYELEDMLNNLATAIADNAKLGYSTNIKGIGTISYKQGHNIRGTSNLTGEEYNTVTRNTLTLKIDSVMSNILNESIG
jgi:nucleoid DNA-binding protein